MKTRRIRRAVPSLPVASLMSAMMLASLACNDATPSGSKAMGTTSSTSAASAASAKPTASAAELTADEKKKAEDAKQLVEDRAKTQAAIKAETARWTPEMHADAKALVEKKYNTINDAIDAVLASKTRIPGNKDRDASRHPKEELAFFGMKPTMTVLEIGPGEGWYTEILAPVLQPQGKLLVTSTDPAGPADLRPTMYGQRTKAFLDKSPELYGKVQTVIHDAQAPALGLDNTVDMVLLIRGMHGMVQQGLHKKWLSEIHKALKADGVLGIEQHRSKADAVGDENGKRGYLPEAWVISEVEAAGFKLATKSELNANAKDTKDYEPGVWALPPTYRLGDKDREKYTAIGESDRMTLKFVKVPTKDGATGATTAKGAPSK